MNTKQQSTALSAQKKGAMHTTKHWVLMKKPAMHELKHWVLKRKFHICTCHKKKYIFFEKNNKHQPGR